MSFAGIIRQIETIDLMPLTADERRDVETALQATINGLAFVKFGNARVIDRTASQESAQVPA
jgi:hypothetical protein